jgi:hypothetical protein
MRCAGLRGKIEYTPLWKKDYPNNRAKRGCLLKGLFFKAFILGGPMEVQSVQRGISS